ncbi:MAG: TVP38/TMEM64 family protein [Pseudonocardia sp.]|jgi:uncharacterized membrane protein YdjX (TVP38/TMEM64 family)
MVSGRWRLALLAVLVVGGTAVTTVLGTPGPEVVEQLLRRLGWAAPVMFVGVCAVLTVLVFPKPVLAIAAGVVFGTAMGTVLVVLGSSLGAAGSYFIGRRAGREAVTKMVRGRSALIDRWLGSHGFIAVLYARLLPVVPFSLVNYTSGVSSIRFAEFIAATVVGIIPGTFVFAALGGSFQDPASPAFLIAVGLSVVLALAGPVVQRTTRSTRRR